MMNQPHYPPQPQVQGENFHLIGTYGTPSPPAGSTYGTPSPQATKQGTSTNKTVNIVIDDDENNDANKKVQKRYWTHEEEERLVSYDQFNILHAIVSYKTSFVYNMLLLVFVGQFLVCST
jgi:hypothetical protein